MVGKLVALNGHTSSSNSISINNVLVLLIIGYSSHKPVIIVIIWKSPAAALAVYISDSK